MPGLILKLRAHEQILVNGVVMQNGERNTRLIIKTPDAKILRLRDAIHPDEVNTPVKRVCYIAQLAVAGEAAPESATRELERGIAQLREALRGLTGCASLDDAGRELSRGNFYGCLRKLRQLLPVEEKLLAEGGNPLPAPAHASGRPRMPLPADRPTSVPSAMRRVTGATGATAAVTGIDRQGLQSAGWPRAGE
ncbi:MAG: flagellar biosynthesis repressor FlbT [Pseudomonadota bacterium]